MVGVRVEPDGLAHDELDVAPDGSPEAPTVDDRHRVDLELERDDRRRPFDRHQARTGLERLERSTHGQLALRIDEDAEPLVQASAEELEALADAALALEREGV